MSHNSNHAGILCGACWQQLLALRKKLKRGISEEKNKKIWGPKLCGVMAAEVVVMEGVSRVEGGEVRG